MRQKIWQGLLLSVFPLWLALGQQTDKDVEKAKKLFTAATVYYNDKDYEKALSGYQDAYKVAPLPVILFNIAQCNRFLGHTQEAIDGYQKFLRDDPATPYRKEVEDKIKALEELLAKEQARLAQEAASLAASQPASAPASGPLSTPAREPSRLAPYLPYAAPAGLVAAALGFGLSSAVLLVKSGDEDASEAAQTAAFYRGRVVAGVFDGLLVSAAVSGVITYKITQKKRAEAARVGSLAKTLGAP